MTPTKRLSLRNYLELVRLPNVFTAMADVTMGLLVARADETGSFSSGQRIIGLLIAASGLLYMSGVVLNDVFDFKLDALERPERPLPSGRISLKSARYLGWTLLLLGLLLALEAAFFLGKLRPAAVALVLAACIVAYNASLKRTLLGPPAMGACRMLNVLLGMSVMSGPLLVEHWLVAASIGTYIMGVTWLARTENVTSKRIHIILATLVMASGIGLMASLPLWTENLQPLLLDLPRRWYLLMFMLSILIGWRWIWAAVEPVPQRVKMAVAYSILSLVMLDAVACFALRDLGAAVWVLFLLLPTMFAQQWIAST
jgi:4-hydroxybenzoate polyprenyltransferase